MTRRELLLVAAGVLSTPRMLRAQQKAVPVIGYLGSTSAGPAAPVVTAFRQGLSDAGYVERQNVAIEFRWAEGHYDRFPHLAAELVERKVDVIAAGSAAAASAAKDATSTIPISLSSPTIRSRPAWSPV
jgi:putative ABC transport system substrate-binding protein